MKKLFVLLMTIASTGFLYGAEEKTLQETEQDETPLIQAVENGDLAEIKRLLAQGVDVNARGLFGLTALHNAAQEGNVDILNALLQARAKVNIDRDGDTPLFFAGNAEIVDALIKAGAKVDAKNDRGETPLFYAENAEVANALLKAGAKVSERSNNKMTPLFQARSVEIVDALLKEGAKVNERDDLGWTPLFTAYDTTTMQALLEAGANIDEKGSQASTALMVVARSGRPELVRFLLKMGADIKGALRDARLSFNAGENPDKLSARLILGMPELTLPEINALISPYVADEYQRLLQHTRSGDVANFFATLKIRDLEKIKKAVAILEGEIFVFYVPKKDEPRILWNNPLHIVLKEHGKLIKDIEEGRGMVLKNIKDEKRRKEVEEKVEDNIRKQTVTTAKIIRYLTELNPNLWYERNSEDQTPLDLTKGLGALQILEIMPRKTLLDIQRTLKPELKKTRETKQLQELEPKPTSSSQSSMSTGK